MEDKVLRNEVNSVDAINLPMLFNPKIQKYLEDPKPDSSNGLYRRRKTAVVVQPGKKSVYPECDTFVYAAYLPPGLH